MGRRSRRYEVEFTACLLVVGPIPVGAQHEIDSAHFKDTIWLARKAYQAEVMQWWLDWHGQVESPPTSKSRFRFYKKFRTWQKVNMRREDYE